MPGDDASVSLGDICKAAGVISTHVLSLVPKAIEEDAKLVKSGKDLDFTGLPVGATGEIEECRAANGTMQEHEDTNQNLKLTLPEFLRFLILQHFRWRGTVDAI